MPLVILKEWQIEAELFDGEHCAGPVPTLCAENLGSIAETIRVSQNS